MIELGCYSNGFEESLNIQLQANGQCEMWQLGRISVRCEMSGAYRIDEHQPNLIHFEFNTEDKVQLAQPFLISATVQEIQEISRHNRDSSSTVVEYGQLHGQEIVIKRRSVDSYRRQFLFRFLPTDDGYFESGNLWRAEDRRAYTEYLIVPETAYKNRSYSESECLLSEQEFMKLESQIVKKTIRLDDLKKLLGNLRR